MDRLRIKPPQWEKRTIDQLQEHYEIEKELSNRLRVANREDRCHLYTSLYDELFQRVPQHSLLTRKRDSESQRAATKRQMKLLRRFLTPEITYLEVGAGDCSLSIEVSKFVKKAYAIDVSTEITNGIVFPKNLELRISDGCSIPVPEGSVDIAYSYQLMEHLHPDDAFDQLQNIYKALAKGGRYICITSNRLSGPHDISKYFDDCATGFHLKEYTVKELAQFFRKVGFSKVSVYVGGKGFYIKCPVFLIAWFENGLGLLPPKLKVNMANTALFKALLGIRIVAEK